ncbi:MAG: hypothetical protein KIT84_42175 [Labilithrix sp.]|nr:hypothetical protein [Labilithrix sp.]MCW5817683.1 hypothetical protein [Labilithrix sp.]
MTTSALAGCSSDEPPPAPNGGADASAANDAGAPSRCSELSAEYAAVPTVASHVACARDEDCTLIRNGICNWTGELAVNASGADAGATIAATYRAEGCSSLDCGSGGGQTFDPACREQACVRVFPDGGVVPRR